MAALQRLALRGTPKATKQAARYTSAGGAERCGMCRHFAPSSSCARIEGPVSAAGWCQLYSQQVTWRPRAGQGAGLAGYPSLDISFMSAGTLDPRITFTRASTATYFDATGTMRTAAVNVPRWDTNGLLIEEARTNLVLNSGNPAAASWGVSGITVAAPTVTANQVVAPDGTTTAARVVYPAVPAVGNDSALNMLGAGVVTTAAPWSISLWLRGNVGGEQTYIHGTPDGVNYLRQLVTLTATWQRYALTGTATAATWFFSVGTDRRDAGQAATLAQTIFVWGGQIEAGAFATSHIPTTTTAIARAVDLASMPTSTWFNAPAGSLAAEVMVPVFAGACPILELDDNTVANRLAPSLLPPQVYGLVSTAGAQVNSITANSATAGQPFKAAMAYDATGSRIVLNGGAVASAGVPAGGMPGGLTFLRLMQVASGGVPTLTGYIRRVRYWPRALSAAELQSVTT